ncbi:MAG TPA: DHHA1 domain-containing protein [Candidatus Dormibacteraeota bacterium]
MLITHTDLDGTACAVIYAATTGRDDYRLVENGSVEDAIRAAIAGGAREIVLADHSVAEEFVPEVEAFVAGGGRFHLLDHHRSALSLNVHPWADVDVSHSGAGLLWAHVGKPPALAEFAALVEDHDLWQHTDPRSERLAALLGLLGTEAFIARFVGDPRVEFSEGELLLLDHEDRRREDYVARKVEQAEVLQIAGRRWAIVFAEQYWSVLAHELMERLDVDATAIVNAARGTVSLRGRGLDVSVIAKALGGGGHANAAAFRASSELAAGLDRFKSDLEAALGTHSPV